MPQSDTAVNDILIARLKSGDYDAFNLIYNQYWSILYDKAYQRMRDKDVSLDILQNVFTDLWTRREQIEIENLSAYLHTAVRFQSFKHFNDSKHSTPYLDYLDEIIVSPIRADDRLREDEITKLIEKWLLALPEKRRKIFLMHYAEELSTREIANRMNISQKTVQSHLYTASQSLRKRIGHLIFIAAILEEIQKR